jgi:hypothetical protein
VGDGGDDQVWALAGAPHVRTSNLLGLWLTPIRVVPQRDRQPRNIVDFLSTTQPLVPNSNQFGCAFTRVLTMGMLGRYW